jgi:hypothetical protein
MPFDARKAAEVYLGALVVRIADSVSSWPEPAIFSQASDIESRGHAAADEVCDMLGLQFTASETSSCGDKMRFVAEVLEFEFLGGANGWDFLCWVIDLCPPWSILEVTLAAGLFESWATESRVRENENRVREKLRGSAVFREMATASWGHCPSLRSLLDELKLELEPQTNDRQ